MEQTPYLKTKFPNDKQHLKQTLDAKLQYISDVKQAIDEDNDRVLYQLINNQEYQTTVMNFAEAEDNQMDFRMIDNLMEDLSHHLAQRLIEYLSEKFPFFYYEEETHGVYQLYFGNWWDRRRFGLLDPLTVNFIFDEEEYDKLSRAVELSESGRRYHTDVIEDTTRSNEELQKIVDTQKERDAQYQQLSAELDRLGEKAGMFESQETKTRREAVKKELANIRSMDEKALEVPKLIAENNAIILDYSKEDTILIYEQRAINDEFGDFETFKTAVQNLYHDYVSQLPEVALIKKEGNLHD
ncbi:hypothetical protein [Weissella kandleri]|nr:hypothetical protein [Weissella kandleri]